MLRLHCRKEILKEKSLSKGLSLSCVWPGTMDPRNFCKQAMRINKALINKKRMDETQVLLLV